MPHLDPDRLVFLALDEQAPSAAESEHLETCESCRTDRAESRAVVRLGRDSRHLRELESPPDEVWSRIAAEAFAAPVIEKPAPKRWRLALVAAVAAVLGVAGVIGVQQFDPRDTGRVVAEADLLPQPAAPPTAHGTVQIVDTGHGLQMRLALSGMPDPTGYYAVWLYDGSSVMVPVGSPGPAALNVPAAAGDLGHFRIVDVSLQTLGEQEHGVSMLQGRLKN